MPRTLDEIAQKIVANAQTGREPIAGFSACVRAAEQGGIDPLYAQTFLIGLQACREWYQENRSSYEMAKFGEEIRRNRDGTVTSSHSIWADWREEYNRFTREEKEVLLLLGYMQACKAQTVSKRYLAPLTSCIQEILELPDYEEQGYDPEDRVYRLLWKRGNDFRKKLNPEFKSKNGHDAGMQKGETFFREIHSILYRIR